MPFIKNTHHLAVAALPNGVKLDARQVLEVTEAELSDIRAGGYFMGHLTEFHPTDLTRVVKSPGVLAAAEVKSEEPAAVEPSAPAPALEPSPVELPHAPVEAPPVEAAPVEAPPVETSRRGRPRKGN